MTFKAKLRRIGTSIGIIIPHTIIMDLNKKDGDIIMAEISTVEEGVATDKTEITFKKPEVITEKIMWRDDINRGFRKKFK